MFIRELLENAIHRSGYRIDYICNRLNMSRDTFVKKRNGVIDWKLNEIRELCKILDINENERDSIFFNNRFTKV